MDKGENGEKKMPRPHAGWEGAEFREIVCTSLYA